MIALTRPFLTPILGAVPRYARITSPIGELLLVGDGESLTGLYMEPLDADPKHGWLPSVGPGWRHDPGVFTEVCHQLGEYFAGERRAFDLSVAPTGTPFQLRVWQALTTVPYATTTSYGAIAGQIGQPTASRAIGMANGRNPVSVIVPCHRIIGVGGALTGYGGGLSRKRFLLELETRGTGLFESDGAGQRLFDAVV
jgi:methylated-DNA-[protein]-cysteine S-methyltransferase